MNRKVTPTPVNAPVPVLPEYYRDETHRKAFVRQLFDRTADDYDRVEGMASFGSGSWYRRQALKRSGLQRGMKVLDVAAGTGLTSRAAVSLTADAQNVVALDASLEMLRRAHQALAIPVVQASAEKLPCRDSEFDFLSMGYALRHLSDLNMAFGEFFRVVKPAGRICLLEISRPRGKLATGVLKLYMKTLVPWAARLMTRHVDSQVLMRFYWDTIEACVPPADVLAALGKAGFEQIERHTELGIFSEYIARKPAVLA